MATYLHTPIWFDPLWDCGPREILPEDDDLWFVKCDHCNEIGRFERRLACERNGLWCEAHAPFRHPDDDRQPFEVTPYRWQSLRDRRRWFRPPTPAPDRGPRKSNVSEVSALPAALAPGGVYRRREARDGVTFIEAFDVAEIAEWRSPGCVELEHYLLLRTE